MSATAAPRLVPASGARWWAVAPALAVGLGGLGVLFWAEAAAAFRVWMDSTAYTHCFLVLPVAAFLAWERRDAVAAAPLRPTLAAALAAILPALAWLAADRLDLMEGRQLAAMIFVQVLCLAVLGWPMARALAGPLLYLVFLVPFGAFLEPALQGFTAWFIVLGLNALGIPNFADGYIIEIPDGVFLVAEACAGLRFLIASLAFGAVYALTMYRDAGRRTLFMVAALVVPIVANGLRALGIVVLGHLLGNAEAAAADHLVYGWVFFSIVIVALAAAGAPFRQARNPVVPGIEAAGPANSRVPLAVAACVVMLAAAGPLLLAPISHRIELPGFMAALQRRPPQL